MSKNIEYLDINKPVNKVQPLVSVCITTYNHEPYITQALDSVLVQETDFDFEIVLGEDDSSDNTRDICIDYAEKYPDKIRLYLNDRKNVIYIDGIATGRWNFTNNIKQARGKYIAILEGDDYWVDKKKLQIQVDLLELYKNCSMCFHNAFIKYESTQEFGDFKDHLVKNYGENPLDTDEIKEFSIKDVLGKWMIPTASIMFRRQMLGTIPEWFYKIFSADYALHLLLADKGNLIYIDKQMSVWRWHSKGLSANCTGVWQQKNVLNILHNFNKYTDYKYDKQLAHKLAKEYEEISFGGVKNSAGKKVSRSLNSLLISMHYYKYLEILTLGRVSGMLAKWILNAPVLKRIGSIFRF
jgi:glycosyltransferase involved in cell wall biosynthesis